VSRLVLAVVTSLAALAASAACGVPSETTPGGTTTAGPTGRPTSKPLPRMPNVVGRNLQDAQDALQAAGVGLLSQSHDATGQGRHQVLDRNWQVCDQKPKAGQPVPADVLPDLGVVRVTETCP